jgi:imidazoleglycerol-phosphate dehydratase
MEEALVACALDLGGRPGLGYQLAIPSDRLGGMEAELVEEFFKSICNAGLMNIHLVQMAGTNSHHIVEAAFKGFGRALDQATRIDPRSNAVPSTKGVL